MSCHGGFCVAIVTLMLLVGGAMRPVQADNAVPVAVQEVGDHKILFFSHESPVRAGLVHLSVMVLQAEAGEPLMDWEVKAIIEPAGVAEDAAAAWISPACQVNPPTDENGGIPLVFAGVGNGNPLAKGTTVVLSHAGLWRITGDFTLHDGVNLSTDVLVKVEEPNPPLKQYWPWFAVIPVAIVGYIFSRRPEVNA